MNRLEFLGKLRMVYCGDKNAFDDISAEQERLSIIEEKYKDCTQYYVKGFKEEIARLNNIINELEEYMKPYLYMLNGIQDRDVYEQCQLDDFTDIMEKLQELKENK